MTTLEKFEDLVGKTLSNVERIENDYHQDEIIFTLDNGDKVKAQIWDTAGQ